jgi:hypothetical protein
MKKICINGMIRNMTAEEQAQYEVDTNANIKVEQSAEEKIEELAVNVNDALEAIMLLSLE